MTVSKPIATIIVITYNSAAQIGACLDAAARLEPHGAYEVLVLDNASADASVAVVRHHAAPLQLLAETENWGFAGGVNRAVAQAKGEYVLLLNPDALPEPTWAAELVDTLRDPNVGVVGSKVLDADGSIQSLGTVFDRHLLLTTHRQSGDGNVDAVHGAAMGFAKQLWHDLGGFDEGFYPAYWEEVDFCQRVLQTGKRVVVVPDAVVGHAEASSTGKYSAEFYGYYLRNRLRYAAKWLDWQTLWHSFRLAEHTRLANADLLDRRVAREVYAQGVPPLAALGPAERAAVRAFGSDLRSGALPADAYRSLIAQIDQAAAASVHHETPFTSRIGLLARFRRAWNNVATRWYVQPNFDQQTRFNLATERALRIALDHELARSAAAALDSALLAWRIDNFVINEHNETQGKTLNSEL